MACHPQSAPGGSAVLDDVPYDPLDPCVQAIREGVSTVYKDAHRSRPITFFPRPTVVPAAVAGHDVELVMHFMFCKPIGGGGVFALVWLDAEASQQLLRALLPR